MGLVRARLITVSTALLLAPTAAMVVASAAAEPSPVAAPTPRVTACQAGDKPETGMQGRIPPADIVSGRAAQGYTCNATQVGFFPSLAGWRVERYGDCAYYNGDPGGQPLGAANISPRNPSEVNPLGVHVMDVSDPTKPVQTAFLQSPAMQSPHESMSLNVERGLLVSVLGNAVQAPGVLEIYDVKADCRRPKLLNRLVDGVPLAPNLEAKIGHEGQFSADGLTYYASGGSQLTAIDVKDPSAPRFIAADDSINSHGLSTSADGRLLYAANLADPRAGLIVYDVSSIQDRKAAMQFRELSRLTWPNITIPQSTNPVTIAGRQLLLESDEFGGRGTLEVANDDEGDVGAARLIDIKNPAKTKVVSDLRLEVHQRAVSGELSDDTKPLLGGPYTGHYCSIPQAIEPGIVACSMLRSGLRIFDVRDPDKPREVAYFSPPASQNTEDGLRKGRGDPTQPARAGLHVGGSVAFVPERREIWLSGQETGFYVIRLAPSAWPDAAGAPPLVPALAPTPNEPAAAPRASASRGGGVLAATGPAPAIAVLALGVLLTTAVLARRNRLSRPPR